MKIMLIFSILFFFNHDALADLSGKWTSVSVSVSSSVGNFENCNSSFEIFLTSEELSFTPVIPVQCQGVNVNLKTLKYRISEDGVLTNANGRGKISDISIFILNPVRYPDGSVVESVSEMNLQVDGTLQTHYVIELLSGYKIEVTGSFKKSGLSL